MTVDTDTLAESVLARIAEDEEPAHTAVHCLCGRFARWVSDRHYYNGSYNCYSYTVRCTRCGDATIECV